MTAGDAESIFSGHPQRRLGPHAITGGWPTVDHILLCTDGFARLITDYGLYGQWTDVITDGHDKGLVYLEKLIRDAEGRSAATSRRRFKKADDVAALLLIP
jgi:hypothetical protein